MPNKRRGQLCSPKRHGLGVGIHDVLHGRQRREAYRKPPLPPSLASLVGSTGEVFFGEAPFLWPEQKKNGEPERKAQHFTGSANKGHIFSGRQGNRPPLFFEGVGGAIPLRQIQFHPETSTTGENHSRTPKKKLTLTLSSEGFSRIFARPPLVGGAEWRQGLN